jgi:hypothetical protein
VRRRVVVALIVLAAVVAAYLAGYLPEPRCRLAVESQLSAIEADLAMAEGTVRIGQLLGTLLVLEESVLNQNYGRAGDRASAFFNNVRAEISKTADPMLRGRLTRILEHRDDVTAGLARGEPAVLPILREIELQLREALGFEVPETRPRTPALRP